MYEKFEKVLKHVLQNDTELAKFIKLETIDEMYDYFLEQIPGLSTEDFDNFIVEMLEIYAKNQKEIIKLKPETLSHLSGGTNLETKVAAGVIAILSAFPISTKGTDTTITTTSPPKQSIMSKISQVYQNGKNIISTKFPKTKAKIKNNPVKAIVAIVLTVAIVYFTTKHFKKQKPKILTERQLDTIEIMLNNVKQLRTLPINSKEYEELHCQTIELYRKNNTPGLITKNTTLLRQIASELGINADDTEDDDSYPHILE